MVELQLDELEAKQKELQSELEEKTITDKQLLEFEPFAAQMRQDLE